MERPGRGSTPAPGGVPKVATQRAGRIRAPVLPLVVTALFCCSYCLIVFTGSAIAEFPYKNEFVQDEGAGGTPPLRLSAWGPWQCHCEAGTQARWRRVLGAQVTRPARPPQLVQEAACNLQQCTRCTARDCRLLPHKRAVGF